MKKILGISLVAVLAATPLMANAEGTAPTAATTSSEPFVGVAINAADREATASAAYVKGAYNAAIGAVNSVKSDLSLTGGDGIDITNKTVKVDLATTNNSNTSGLEIDANNKLKVDAYNGITVDANGVSVNAETNKGITVGANGVAVDYDDSTIDINSTSHKLEVKNGGITTDKIADSNVTTGKIADGAVTTGKLDAGAVTTAKLADEAVTLSKIEADDMQQGTGDYASSTKLTSKGYVDQAVAGINTTLESYATQDGVENTIETATITATVASQSVTGYVPVMVNWGDTTANSNSAVALASGATAGGVISNVSISATYAEPQGDNGGNSGGDEPGTGEQSNT